MVFHVWVHKQMPLNSQWLVLRIGGADFFHCWVADSVWLDHAESVITISDSFHGGLFRALTSFTAVLPVNNSLVHRVGLLLLGPRLTTVSLDIPCSAKLWQWKTLTYLTNGEGFIKVILFLLILFL